MAGYSLVKDQSFACKVDGKALALTSITESVSPGLRPGFRVEFVLLQVRPGSRMCQSNLLDGTEGGMIGA